MTIPQSPLPSNPEAEKALLGHLLTEPAIASEVVATVKQTDYYTFAHGLIHGASVELLNRGIPPDCLTVWQVISEKGLMAEIGGAYCLADLVDSRSVARDWKHWAAIVKDAALRRDLLRLADEIRERAGDLGESPGDVLRAVEAKAKDFDSPTKSGIERFHVGEMIKSYPRLLHPVVDGLIRERETCNIISYSKIGKSWLTYALCLSIVTGRHWLDRFPTAKGRVLIVDNELHRPTIASRIQTVADAMEIPLRDYAAAIEVWPLRGNLRDIHAIEHELRTAQGFRAIIFDAKYRMMPPGASENDNAGETAFYNALDRYAEMTGAAMVCIHHASKGDQSGKRVTDVGAGAGAQSRAADCHLVLREHDDEGTVVLDAAVRSFPPVEPLALRWAFPLWQPTDADPSLLRGRQGGPGTVRKQRDAEGMGKILDLLMKGPATTRQLRDVGFSRERVKRLVGILANERRVTWIDVNVKGNMTREYSLNRDVGD